MGYSDFLAQFYLCFREYLIWKEQLIVRVVSQVFQQYRVRTVFRALSNVSCEFRCEIRFSTTRPLIERNCKLPIDHPTSLKLIAQYLRVIVETIPEQSRLAAIRSLIQIPLDYRGQN